MLWLPGVRVGAISMAGMSSGTRRVAGAVGAVAVSAAVNLATGHFTAHAAIAWWASGITLLIVGVAIQWWLSAPPPEVPDRTQSAVGNKVGGSIVQKMTGPGDQTASDNDITRDLRQTRDE